ncbi:MAG: hydrogenase maturation protease [Desulfurococcales archaeon]|uniref:Hydrogenase maturation protease n=1 Tax=Fervidicoccus fontis TaxID=683846 RepID=A0A7J3SNA8_9CREN|nr:hydrogenase maturation protease [Desulfurococcales archaeon]
MKELTLKELVHILRECQRNEKAVIACVGTELRSDDAIALRLCETLEQTLGDLKIIKCIGGLENCAVEIEETNPEKIVVLDASYIEGVPPGKIYMFSLEDLGSYFAWSHRFPIALVIEVLRQKTSLREFELIGITCENFSLGEKLSEKLEIFLEQFKEELKKANLTSLL